MLHKFIISALMLGIGGCMSQSEIQKNIENLTASNAEQAKQITQLQDRFRKQSEDMVKATEILAKATEVLQEHKMTIDRLDMRLQKLEVHPAINISKGKPKHFGKKH